jgi:Flp pilus assembly protein TadG
MIAFAKSLWRDRRGNALVIAGAAMPLIVGAAGLATDTIQWSLWKRQLQRAADSAAIAGVHAKMNSQVLATGVSNDLARNNHTYATLLSGYPLVDEPGGTTGYDNAVQVTLAVQKELGFSSFFLSAAPIITTTATAAAVNDGIFCAGGLDPSTTAAVSVGGSAHVDLGCGVISNSTSPTESVSTNGSTYSFVASPVAGAGGLPSAINGASNLQPHHLPLADPFLGLYPTTIPAAAQPCANFAQKSTVTSVTGQGQNRVTTESVQPGCFNSFNPGNNTYILQPGVYYLNNTNFSMQGNTTMIGTGVTFILTGTTPGSLQINGTSKLQLTAPTSTTCGTFGGVNSCTYEKMLFIQSANATVNNNNTVNGTNDSFFDGAMYFPKGQVNFNGTSGTSTKCVMVIGWHINFNGNTNLQNNTTGCAANKTFTSKKVRLIA